MDLARRNVIVTVLRETQSKNRAAANLGIVHQTIYDLIKKFGITESEWRGQELRPDDPVSKGALPESLEPLFKLLERIAVAVEVKLPKHSIASHGNLAALLRFFKVIDGSVNLRNVDSTQLEIWRAQANEEYQRRMKKLCPDGVPAPMPSELEREVLTLNSKIARLRLLITDRIHPKLINHRT